MTKTQVTGGQIAPLDLSAAAGEVASQLPVANGGTGVSTLTGIVKGNGTSAFTAAAAGTDYVAPGGVLGTPSSGDLSNCTGFPASSPDNVTTVTATSGTITSSYVIWVFTGTTVGNNTYTLPAASSSAGLRFLFFNRSATVGANFLIQVATSDWMILGNTVTQNGNVPPLVAQLATNTAPSVAELECDGSYWIVKSLNGYGISAWTTGTLAVNRGGSGATTLTGLVKGNGTSAFTAAAAGTDYVTPGGALGTPSSGTLTNCTGLPLAGLPDVGTLGRVRCMLPVFGSQTLTISGGNVTQLSGTTVDGVTVAIGDRILITCAPASTGVNNGPTIQPGNGVYVVTGNTTNLSVSRDADMSGSFHPSGRTFFVTDGLTNVSYGYTVTAPADQSAFTYGTNNIRFGQTMVPSPYGGSSTLPLSAISPEIASISRVRCAGSSSLTYTISSGRVTQISGTTVDSISPAVGDRILIKDAPASTGAGSSFSSQPGNGIYTVSGNTTNLTLARASDMTTGFHPAGRTVFVMGGNVWSGVGLTVTTPNNDNTSFTYGSGNIQWTTTMLVSPVNNSNTITMTNKTLTGPKIDQILDSNGHVILDMPATSSAVNYLQITNSATTNALELTAAGSDSNIGVDVAPKGAAGLTVGGRMVELDFVNGSTGAQSQVVVSGTNYYISNSNLTFPNNVIAFTRMRWRVAMTKTAAGTGTFQISIYRGTTGSTSDTQDVLQTIGTQTAVVDNMVVDVEVVITTAGATGAYYWSIVPVNKAVTAAGFGVATGTGAFFSGNVSSVNLTAASLRFGLGFKATTGTPTIVIPMVQSNAFHLM